MLKKIVLGILLVSNFAFASRVYMSPPIVFSGDFNKATAAGTWPNQAISELMVLSIRNPSSISQRVKVTFRFEGISWSEYGSRGVNQFPLASQTGGSMTVINGTSASNVGGTLSGNTFTIGTDYVVVAPETTVRVDVNFSYRGPVSNPNAYPHVSVRNSSSIKIEVAEDRGVLNSTVRVFGSNGNAGLLEDSNLHAFAPYVLPLNGARPF